ncbi:fimbrial protein [Serratia fonticola]|uniref:Fimbrial protein n=1 Tax=Serratia fonticola TaxID=47917 RepID=A0ABY9PSB2_SERFO|nr:fimbrial protein [Serratia fonticola]WMT16055.1 fimbrial protein [Serratia fonticola]
MGNVKVIMCIVFLLQGFLFEVNAADINVNGQVVASPCIIDIATENQTVDFGKLQHRDFSATGSASEWIPISLKLTTCPASTSKVIANFSGSPDDDDSALYNNAGTARNIAVQLSDVTHAQKLGMGSSLTVAVDSALRTATVPLASRLFSVNGMSKGGSIIGAVQVGVTYQ